MKKMLVATSALALMVSAPANAASYLVSYEAVTGAFSATIETTDIADANGFFTITSLVGTKGGAAATLLPIGSLGYTDNLIKLTPDYVTSNGFSFSAGGSDYNVYRGDVTMVLNECGPISCSLTTDPVVSNFSITAAPVNGAVPEPATWAMMIAGFGAVGFAMRRRKVATRVQFA